MINVLGFYAVILSSEVMEALRKHYLARFIHSPFYQQLKQEMKRKESIHHVLQASQMVEPERR